MWAFGLANYEQKNTMRKLLAISMWAAMATLSLGAQWGHSWHDALKQSEKTKKPMLIFFTGSDWCGWCKRLKAEVLDTPEFAKFAKNFVLLEVDMPRTKPLPKSQFEHNKALLEWFKVTSYPTILFVNAKGDVIGKSGYVEGGPKAWIQATNVQFEK